jgi:hypothetical protein
VNARAQKESKTRFAMNLGYVAVWEGLREWPRQNGQPLRGEIPEERSRTMPGSKNLVNIGIRSVVSFGLDASLSRNFSPPEVSHNGKSLESSGPRRAVSAESLLLGGKVGIQVPVCRDGSVEPP